MKVKDLGQLEGPVLLFGGPYSNLQATEALLHQAKLRGIPGARMICTGDVVAYGADPEATVAAVRDAGSAVVAGNCERQLGANAQGCGCGFEAGTTCDLLSAGWFAHADAHVGRAARAWMADCPDIILFTQAGRRWAVIHGGVSDVSRFVWSVSDTAVFREEIDLLRQIVPDISGVVCGHSGIAFRRQVDGITWLNAGVIGLPPHDGETRTEFAVLEAGEAHLERLDYDHDAAADAMRRAGLTQGYHRSLVTGYWPSQDVLPHSLRVPALASG